MVQYKKLILSGLIGCLGLWLPPSELQAQNEPNDPSTGCSSGAALPPLSLASQFSDELPANVELERLADRDGSEIYRQTYQGVPIFGMHRGTVGFLMNHFEPDRLTERIKNASRIALTPLKMRAETGL